jgi:hypothetical protein
MDSSSAFSLCEKRIILAGLFQPPHERPTRLRKISMREAADRGPFNQVL